MGAQVEEFPDGMRVAGRSAGKLHGAKIDPHGDHRIAMALPWWLSAPGRHRFATPIASASPFLNFSPLWTVCERPNPRRGVCTRPALPEVPTSDSKPTSCI